MNNLTTCIHELDYNKVCNNIVLFLLLYGEINHFSERLLFWNAHAGH